jgi:hypothetical protein
VNVDLCECCSVQHPWVAKQLLHGNAVLRLVLRPNK